MEHPDSGIDPKINKPVKRSLGWFGINTIYGRDGDHGTPYMTRAWIGRLRLHIFHRGDNDPDCHDHPWDFWTFPLTSYVEEVVRPNITEHARRDSPFQYADGVVHAPETFTQVVPAFRLSHRPATHCHRVLGRYSGNVIDDFGFDHCVSASKAMMLQNDRFTPQIDNRKIVTLVWRGEEGRKWGFLKNRHGRWCWVHWKEYVFGGGKDAPCGPSKGGDA